MKTIKALGSGIKNFMIIFSFIVNLVLVVVVVALILFIFDIKNNIVTPLVAGLNSSFVGLDNATIDWTIPVRDRIPVILNIPLQTDTVVTLTDDVPLSVSAVINLPGVGQLNNAQVYLQLPRGLELPVALDLNVAVDQDLPVALDVRAVIPLNRTQLHDPFANLELLFGPLTNALYNLPNNFNEAGQMVGDVLSGQSVDLLAESTRVPDAWTGYSTTAGLGYTLGDQPVPITNQAVNTGIVAPGGIPAIDQEARPDLYANNSSPAEINANAEATLSALGVDPATYNGQYSSTSQEQSP